MSTSDIISEWGPVYDKNRKKCPMTAIQVATEAFKAIAGTLYNKQKPDPSISSNARSNSLYSHRPTRSLGEDGRIGIEIDGAEFLFPPRMSSGKAQRVFSLILSSKLSRDSCWDDYEDEIHSTDSFRPVALSFNTIKEALLARREMKILQRNCRTESERAAFDHIIIQTLSDGVPEGLFVPKSAPKKTRRLKNLSVDAKKGILVAVQPTDFNQDFDPARPSIHSLNDFQKTITQALIQRTPVVVLSPRFLSYDENDAPDNAIYPHPSSQASYYGGREPPRGPAPFILRDFYPPSYFWASMPLDPVIAAPVGDDALSAAPDRRNYNQFAGRRLILTNSVMDDDHPWHIYASNTEEQEHSGRIAAEGDSSGSQAVYLASTRSTSGRPTRAIMNRIFLSSMTSI